LATPRKNKTNWLLVVAAGVFVLVAAGVSMGILIPRRNLPGPTVRTTLTLPPDVTLLTLSDEAGSPALSPDGSNLVFVGAADGKQMLFVRAMDSGNVRPLAGTEGGKFPFWSTEGGSIGFFAEKQLKRLDLAGGPPVSLAPAPDARGGSWAGNTILFAPYIYGVINRVSASGGKAVPVTAMD